MSLLEKNFSPRCCGMGVVLLCLAGVLNAENDSALRGKLLWKNGESLDGVLRAASAEEITWDSALFTEAPGVKLSVLEGIEFTAKPAVEPAEDFSVVLRDGSRLYASLDSITGNTITLHSARQGKMILRRSEVVSLRRVRGDGLIYSGPAGEARWSSSGKQSQRSSSTTRGRLILNGGGWRATSGPPPQTAGSVWQSGAGGTLTTPVWNRAGAFKLNVYDSMLVDIRLRSSAQIELNLTLINNKKERVSIETWGDELVAVQGSHFERLRKLSPNDRTLALRLCWSSVSGAFAAYAADGTLLTQCTFADHATLSSDAPGLGLLNKGLDLTLESLRVRAWDGKPSQPMEVRGARVELTDGSVMAGSVTIGATGTISIQGTSQAAASAVPLERVEAIFFEPPPFTGPRLPAAQIWYADGAMLLGRLLEIKDGSASLQTTFSESAITASLADARRIALQVLSSEPSEELPIEKLDSLTISNPKTTLHGTLVGTGDPAPHWRLLGSARSVMLKETSDMVLSHASAVKAKSDALLYLTRGEVVPAKVLAMDRESVEMQSPITELHRVAAADLRAIQFNNTSDVKPDGFTDPGWHQVSGDEKMLKRTNDSIEIGVGTAFGHPTMLQGDEISFSIKGVQGYGAVRVKFFTPGTDVTTSSASLVVGHFGNRVYVMSEEGGQSRNQQQAPADYKRPSTVRFKFTEKNIEITVNGVVLESQALKPEQRQGLGLIFESTSMWGNGERSILIADFSLKTSSGQTWVPSVAVEPKKQALLIPRFRRDSPPHQVLLATNGDLLRGEIEAYAANHFSFLTGLETVRVPRNRVAAAIWLKQPNDEKKTASDKKPEVLKLKYATPPRPPTHWLLLSNGAQIGLAVGAFDADAVLGQHALLGACHVPLADIVSIRHTAPPATAAMRAFEDWQLEFAPEPVLPESGGQDSPLLGKDAKDFTLPLLTGGTFSLKAEKGKVIVLDFWATWCGPCIKSLPELISSMIGFDSNKVKLIGVNQAESPEQVKRFLETRSMGLVVALDADQKIGRQFGVEGIPHTVIIGPDGKIAWVKTGYEPGGAKEAADVVKKLLEGK